MTRANSVIEFGVRAVRALGKADHSEDKRNNRENDGDEVDRKISVCHAADFLWPSGRLLESSVSVCPTLAYLALPFSPANPVLMR